MRTVERNELIKAWVAVSLAFTIAFNGFNNFIIVFLISAFTGGIGFLLHELAHKYLAQKFHCHAEFRANDQMLLLGVVISFFGFIFLAPGGVVIHGHLSRKHNGIVSLGGPLMNLILAIFFIIGNFLFPNIIFLYGAIINSFLGLFNLLPFPMFDGVKVLEWNKVVYFFSLALSGILMVLVYS